MKLTKETVYAFVRDVIQTMPKGCQSIETLLDIRRILTEQGADSEIVDIVSKMIDAAPEVTTASRNNTLSAETFADCVRRANERMRRQLEMMNNGRC
ncbi:MAG: hypothetical protein MJ142_08180 [Clostridia bacterium]|nr:hypothetical protein [Clostridia bacterium]